jgi:putative hydrolases of HD superfamily
MADERLNRQIEFLAEMDKLKTVFRRAYLIADPDRRENSAEHSWHVMMLAFVLAEYCQEPINLDKVLRILLFHDIVEIDAGDTGIYDRQMAQSKAEREHQAAGRIFGLLPADQQAELNRLWLEHEQGRSEEARFARAVDRLIPLLLNYFNQGKRWKEDGITFEQVMAVNQIIRESSPALWELAVSLINDSVAKGYLKKAAM